MSSATDISNHSTQPKLTTPPTHTPAEAARLAILKKKITLEDFKAFDVDGDGTIERSEFIIRKLMLMGLVNQGDISLCENEFMSMDTDGSGEITLEDLANHLEEMAKKAA